MSKIFSDEIVVNPPKDVAELATRLNGIKNLINNDENLREVSIEFCRRAFGLLTDFGLITEETVKFLSDAQACTDYDPKLKFPYNAFEGVLRKVECDNDIYDEKGVRRFYRGDKMCVICGGKKYLIANNWFGDGPTLPNNRRAFYNWTAVQVIKKFVEAG